MPCTPISQFVHEHVLVHSVAERSCLAPASGPDDHRDQSEDGTVRRPAFKRLEAACLPINLRSDRGASHRTNVGAAHSNVSTTSQCLERDRCRVRKACRRVVGDRSDFARVGVKGKS